MRTYLSTLIRDERGTTAVEFALLAVLMSVGMISALVSMQTELLALWDTVSQAFADAIGAA